MKDNNLKGFKLDCLNRLDEIFQESKPYVSPYTELYQRLMPYVNSALDSLDKDELGTIIGQSDTNAPKNARIQVVTEVIAVTWSGVLHQIYNKQGETQLREYLLPDNLGPAEQTWNINLGRTDLSQKLVKDILQKFSQKELPIELPWGGYVTKVEDSYKLTKNK
jgi:hypothetical protein